MVFITNNLSWAASSVCDLYQSRWAIEVFFKQIKQTLQICDMVRFTLCPVLSEPWPLQAGNTLATLVSSLLLYVLLRFHAWNSAWPHSFTCLFIYNDSQRGLESF